MENQNEDKLAPNTINWRIWSTAESVRNREPSVMAVAETCLAPILYLWLAFHVGWLLPLYVAIAVAPFVLLRSDKSVALGVKWVQRLQYVGWGTQRFSLQLVPSYMPAWIAAVSVMLGVFVFNTVIIFKFWGPPFSEGHAIQSTAVLCGILFLSIMIMVPLFAFAMALVIRIAATVIFWREGIKSLPENFRVLILCISPSQIPELVPGIEATNSLLAFSGFRKFVASFDLAPEPIRGLNAAVKEAVYVSQALILFLPAWAYRTTIKSTIWFWWPLAFIGGDLRFAGKPDLLRWNLIGSLWAKASILIAFLSLLAFICTNAFLDGAIFEKNPLITPIGYFLLLDWRLQPWQICAILASAMSVVLVFWMDHIAGRFRIAENTGDTALQRTVMTELGWMERFARLRFLFVLSFWFLVAAHALLYLNGQTCAVHLPDYVQRLAHTIYGNRTPKNLCTQNTAKQNGVPIGRDDLIDAVCARLLVLERSRAGCGSVARRLGSSGLTIHPG